MANILGEAQCWRVCRSVHPPDEVLFCFLSNTGVLHLRFAAFSVAGDPHHEDDEPPPGIRGTRPAKIAAATIFSRRLIDPRVKRRWAYGERCARAAHRRGYRRWRSRGRGVCARCHWVWVCARDAVSLIAIGAHRATVHNAVLTDALCPVWTFPIHAGRYACATSAHPACCAQGAFIKFLVTVIIFTIAEFCRTGSTGITSVNPILIDFSIAVVVDTVLTRTGIGPICSGILVHPLVAIIIFLVADFWSHSLAATTAV